MVRLLHQSRPFLGLRAPKLGDIGFVIDGHEAGKAYTVEIGSPGKLECLAEFEPEELAELDDSDGIG